MNDKIQITEEMIKASGEIYNLLFSKLNSETGIHIGTFISASARLAGTCLFRSFNFRKIDAEPGTAVLSEEANVEGQKLMNLLFGILSSFKVDVNPNESIKTPDEHLPKISITQMQMDFQDEYFNIMKKYKFDYFSSAIVGVFTSAGIIHETKDHLNPNISVGIAIIGLIEGSKTLPVPLKNKSN